MSLTGNMFFPDVFNDVVSRFWLGPEPTSYAERTDRALEDTVEADPLQTPGLAEASEVSA